MLIHSLTLENVKSYAHATVEFGPGANAIIGSNGSGKTTILEAIGFALFDHRPGKLADFVREGQALASVTVDFLSDYDERVYRVIKRCRSSGGSNVYRIFDPELNLNICEGRADVIQFLRPHLGIDPETDSGDLFTNAVCVPQGSFTASFLATPGVRKVIFDPFLKVAEYRRAFERLREPLNLLNKRRSDQEVQIGRLQGELTRLPAAQADAKMLTDRTGSVQNERHAVRTELATAESDRQAMEAKREQLLELQRVAQMRQQTLVEKKRTLSTLQQRLKESEEALATTEANHAGHQAYRAAQQDQRAVNERMTQRRLLQEERNVVQTRLTQAETQEEAHTRVLAEIIQAEKTAADLASAAADQEKLDAELRDAQRQADRLHSAGARQKREQTAVSTMKKRLDLLRMEVAQSQQIEASLQPLQARIETLQQEKNAFQSREAQLQAEIETLRKQGTQLKDSNTSAICPICEQPLSAEHRQQLLDRLRKRWEKLKMDAQTAAKSTRQAETDREKIRATLAQQERTLRSLPRQDAVKTAEAELVELHAQLAEASAEVQSLAQAPQRVEHLRQALTALGDPRRRRDVALQQAQRRSTVEAALQQQRAQAELQRTPLAALDRRIAALASVDSDAARITSQLEKFRTADSLFLRSQAAAEALPRRQRDVTELEKALETAEERYTSVRTELADRTREFDERRFQEAKARVETLRSRRVQLKTELGHLRERLAQAEEEIVQLQTQAQRLATAQSLYDGLTQQEEILVYLRTVLQEAGPFVTKALVQKISHRANQLFGQIMEDHTRTLHWQEDYGIVLEVGGRQRDFPQLSGGEQMTAALAVRLALLQEMSDIAIAFFDEPTTNLDDGRRDALARQIVGVRGFQQIFIISHDDSFEQATEKLIRVEKRNRASEIHYD